MTAAEGDENSAAAPDLVRGLDDQAPRASAREVLAAVAWEGEPLDPDALSAEAFLALL